MERCPTNLRMHWSRQILTVSRKSLPVSTSRASTTRLVRRQLSLAPPPFEPRCECTEEDAGADAAKGRGERVRSETVHQRTHYGRTNNCADAVAGDECRVRADQDPGVKPLS